MTIAPSIWSNIGLWDGQAPQGVCKSTFVGVGSKTNTTMFDERQGPDPNIGVHG